MIRRSLLDYHEQFGEPAERARLLARLLGRST